MLLCCVGNIFQPFPLVVFDMCSCCHHFFAYCNLDVKKNREIKRVGEIYPLIKTSSTHGRGILAGFSIISTNTTFGRLFRRAHLVF